MNGLRQQVLQTFKNIHRARKQVFAGDDNALKLARFKINDEYRRKIGITNKDAILELIEYSKGVEKELRTTVIQAEEMSPGKYKLNITKDTKKLDNVPYNECSNL